MTTEQPREAPKTRPGSQIELHMMVCAWLLEGPPRTYAELIKQFHLAGSTSPALYMQAAVHLGLVEKTTQQRPGLGAPRHVFTPVRSLGEKSPETKKIEQLERLLHETEAKLARLTEYYQNIRQITLAV